MTTRRTALVTGGARGIGAAIATRLLRDGWRVVIADRAPGPENRAAADVVTCDVADEGAVNALIGGLDRLDALVCNAGYSIRAPLARMSLADWNALLATNLTSAFLLARVGETRLRAARGAIVTITSTRAHMSEPDNEAYAASKGGLLALTHALALSLGPDVRVNAISPGWITTKTPNPRPDEHAFHPAGRVGRAEDIAALTAFLVGTEAGFITGAEFIVDGGVTRKMIYPE